MSALPNLLHDRLKRLDCFVATVAMTASWRSAVNVLTAATRITLTPFSLTTFRLTTARLVANAVQCLALSAGKKWKQNSGSVSWYAPIATPFVLQLVTGRG